MKVCLYAGHMHLNRKDENKKYVETQKFDFFRKHTGENFFSSPNCSPMDYLASIML